MRGRSTIEKRSFASLAGVENNYEGCNRGSIITRSSPRYSCRLEEARERNARGTQEMDAREGGAR